MSFDIGLILLEKLDSGVERQPVNDARGYWVARCKRQAYISRTQRVELSIEPGCLPRGERFAKGLPAVQCMPPPLAQPSSEPALL